MKIPSLLPAVLVLGTLLAPAAAQDKPAAGAALAVASEPGRATIAGVAKATGVVESIDLQARHVTIKDRAGKLIPLEVHAVYTEAVALTVEPAPGGKK